MVVVSAASTTSSSSASLNAFGSSRHNLHKANTFLGSLSPSQFATMLSNLPTAFFFFSSLSFALMLFLFFDPPSSSSSKSPPSTVARGNSLNNSSKTAYTFCRSLCAKLGACTCSKSSFIEPSMHWLIIAASLYLLLLLLLPPSSFTRLFTTLSSSSSSNVIARFKHLKLCDIPSNPCVNVHNSLNLLAKNCVNSKLSLTRCCCSSFCCSVVLTLTDRTHFARTSVALALTVVFSLVNIASIFCNNSTTQTAFDWIRWRISVVASSLLWCSISSRRFPNESEEDARRTNARRSSFSTCIPLIFIFVFFVFLSRFDL